MDGSDEGVECPECLNGGRCMESDDRDAGMIPYQYCKCREGYYGANCEHTFDDDEVPSSSSSFSGPPRDCVLNCFNGGACSFGEQDSGIFNGLWVKDIDGMYCDCPEGTAGVRCEHLVEVCDVATEQLCLHGSKCVPDEEKKGKYRCECNYGDYECLQNRTMFCVADDPYKPGYVEGAAEEAYCVNNGKCKNMIDFGDDHPGCDCPPLFTGQHCEMVRSSLHGAVHEHPNAKAELASMIFFIMSVSLVFAIIIKRYFVSCFRPRMNRRISRLNLQSFRGDGEDYGRAPTTEACDGCTSATAAMPGAIPSLNAAVAGDYNDYDYNIKIGINDDENSNNNNFASGDDSTLMSSTSTSMSTSASPPTPGTGTATLGRIRGVHGGFGGGLDGALYSDDHLHYDVNPSNVDVSGGEHTITLVHPGEEQLEQQQQQLEQQQQQQQQQQPQQPQQQTMKSDGKPSKSIYKGDLFHDVNIM